MPAASSSAPPTRAETMKASASSPAGTTVLVPLSDHCAGRFDRARGHLVQPVARGALLLRQHHQRLAAGDLRQPAACSAAGALDSSVGATSAACA